jgi:alkanesulfonate monooxygenase SsuD/methylene tetrahydromethanopterin reductase-like flavin-dependent oxidoreductase (luciferase family)
MSCFVSAFAIAGTAADCLAQAQAYFDAGASELVLSFAGAQPEDDMRYLGQFPGRNSSWREAQ